MPNRNTKRTKKRSKRKRRKGEKSEGIYMVSKFLHVKCEKCKNEQVIFERAASVVKCLVCDEVLAKPTGGKALITSESVTEV
jgi:small subunit ribosomal protein S27e